MTTSEMLERIEKLPSEWRHPLADAVASELANQTYAKDDWPINEAHAIALDLHLRTIAEKLAERGHSAHRTISGTTWYIDSYGVFLSGLGDHDTYALALLSAAEAVVARDSQ